jgi:hypothetical protein
MIVALGAVWSIHPALAQSSSFVGRWQWNRAQSTVPFGGPAPTEMTAEFSRVDSGGVSWSLTVLSDRGGRSVEKFEALPDGWFYPINGDTTAAFRLMGNTLEAIFKGPIGQTDTLVCTLTPDPRRMTCSGVLTDEAGRKTSYVDVYDRM